jgi:hypothetical protein
VAVNCVVRPAPPKFIVVGLTVMEVSDGELMQLVSGNTRPASKSAPKQKRLNIVGLLAFFNGFGSAITQRSRTSFSTLDYIPFPHLAT